MKKKFLNYCKPLSILLFSFLLIVCVFFFYLSDLTTYGGTWDELFFHMGTGKMYVDFLKTGDLKPILSDKNSSWFPPVAPTLGYLIQESGLLNKQFPFATDRFHVAAVLFGSITTGAVFLITYLLTGSFLVSILASILLVFHPQFITQSHNNVRDMGLTMFYALTILSMLAFTKSRFKILLMILSGILAGIATATKQNGAFLVILGVMWFTLNFNQLKLKKYIIGMILFGMFFVIFFVAFWPYLWVDTINHLKLMWYFLTDPSIIAGSTTFFDVVYTSMHNIPVYYPWVMLFLLTPMPYALLGTFGFIFCLWIMVKKDKSIALLFLWISVPLSRFIFPLSSISYDQIRHFFEVVPTLPIFVVLSIYYLYKLTQKTKIRYLVLLLALITAGYTINVTFRYRPYGTAYFNQFAGPSSYVNHAFDVEYYGNVYRQAAIYLNSRYGDQTTYYTAGLGAHIFQNDGLMGKMTDERQDPADYAIFMNKQTWLRNNLYAMWLLKNKSPVFTIEREGKVLFYQFENSYNEYKKTENLVNPDEIKPI